MQARRGRAQKDLFYYTDKCVARRLEECVPRWQSIPSWPGTAVLRFLFASVHGLAPDDNRRPYNILKMNLTTLRRLKGFGIRLYAI
jgi:hypothetical protein